MVVKTCMVTDVISIFPDASLSLAFQMMVEKGYSQLPVVKEKKLVGLITEQVLASFSPSKATTLSVYELNYVLSKTTVESIMIKDVVTCGSDMLIEDAASLFKTKDVNSIMVVSRDNTLEGILTKSDIITAFLDIIGAGDTGTTRIVLQIKDRIGTVAEIAETIKEHEINITHITDYYYKDDPSNGEITIRVATLNTDTLIKAFEQKGFTVLSVR